MTVRFPMARRRAAALARTDPQAGESGPVAHLWLER